MTKRKEIKIVESKKGDFIILVSHSGKIINTYKKSDKAKPIKDLHKTNVTNKRRLFEYYNKKAKDYKPTSEKQKESQIKKITTRKVVKQVSEPIYFKTTKGETRQFYSNSRLRRNFKYMFITINVKIFFNGVYVHSRGRSNYVPSINKSNFDFNFNQALKRALGPYGYDVKFKIISWRYGYYQTMRDKHYNSKSIPENIKQK